MSYFHDFVWFQFAEKVTSGAASVALSTTKPVVDRLAPTVNSYANRGLDKLEGVVPQICEEPDEVRSLSSISSIAIETCKFIINLKFKLAYWWNECYIDSVLSPEVDQVVSVVNLYSCTSKSSGFQVSKVGRSIPKNCCVALRWSVCSLKSYHASKSCK